MYFVCDSIHNRIIQKNTHECSYYYDSMNETESANISTMFIDYQNNGQINSEVSEVYGLSDLDNKLKKIFINVFQMRNINITNKSSMKNIEKWDSLNHIGLINEIEEKFNLHFNDEEIVQMTNYKIIINKILNYKNKNT